MSQDEFSRTPLTWMNPPDVDGREFLPGVGMKVTPNPKTDYWLKDLPQVSGHALLYTTPSTLEKWSFQTTFTLNGVVLYDQAGIMVYVGEQV